MRRCLTWLCLGLLTALPAAAGELKGVRMPDSISIEGKQLALNGMGLRTKMVFKVYVAGLYLEHVSKDPAVILAADEIRRVRMYMLRDLDKGTIGEAIRTGFEKNTAADKLPQLKERLDKLAASLPDLKEGQELALTYVPGKGTTLEGKGLTVEGKDFADALFSVWLGKVPVDEDLKKGMLGR